MSILFNSSTIYIHYNKRNIYSSIHKTQQIIFKRNTKQRKIKIYKLFTKMKIKNQKRFEKVIAMEGFFYALLNIILVFRCQVPKNFTRSLVSNVKSDIEKSISTLFQYMGWGIHETLHRKHQLEHH